jgi:hypothetical protein
MFAVMKTFVTIISASTGRNDFIFDIWLWHGNLYRVSTGSRCAVNLERGDMVQVSMPKPYIKDERTDGQGDCNIAPTL